MEGPGSTIVVLEAVKPPDGTTRYIDQVVTCAPSGIRFDYLTSPRALLRGFDVLHLHWPENLTHGPSRPQTVIRCLGVVGLLLYLRLRGTAIVRTVHNLTPHERPSWPERVTLALIDRATDHFVVINPQTRLPREAPSTLVLHGHYKDRFSEYSGSVPRQSDRVVYAGLIRPYKGVSQLIESFTVLALHGSSLRIVGKPTPELKAEISRASAEHETISHVFGFIPDEDLVGEIQSAQLVCLPYQELHNSGMALVALSLGRPVLVPDTATTRALAAEVGERWVMRFEGSLSAEKLRYALECSADQDALEQPTLQARDWNEVGRGYGEVFTLVSQRKSIGRAARGRGKPHIRNLKAKFGSRSSDDYAS